jgi:hypothetical protein
MNASRECIQRPGNDVVGKECVVGKFGDGEEEESCGEKVEINSLRWEVPSLRLLT